MKGHTVKNHHPKETMIMIKIPTRILLVDDEKDFVEMLSMRLADAGEQVTAAYSGQECLEKLAQTSIDVVILDIKMPGMDGIETLRHIKTMAPLIETIMLTAHGTIPTGVEAMHAGARDFLMKPCDLAELTVKVETAAKRKRERESKISDVRVRPYITDREKEALIAAILDS